MKSIFTWILLASMMFSQALLAQKAGNGNLSTRTFELSQFSGIEAGGAIKVIYNQAPEYNVYFETDENLLDQVKMEVEDGVLKISVSNVRNATRLHANVTSPSLEKVKLSGAASFVAETAVQTEVLSLEGSGAAKIDLAVSGNQLITNLSGASKATLSGAVVTHEAQLSGASKLMAKALETENTKVLASGASDAWVTAQNLEQDLSGAAKVNNETKPVVVVDHEDKVYVRTSESHNGDTVNVNVGSVRVQVIDGDSTVVVVGSRKLIVDEDGNVNLTRDKKKEHRFNGHWAGVEIGINGLLTPDFNMSYGQGLGFLDQRMEKSINVNLNFFEQNIPLNRKGTIGLVSGLGLTWNNYRFANNVMVVNEDNRFQGFYMEGVSVKKSKLVNNYLTLPLFLEFQTNAERKRENAHLAIGVVAGWRFSSHTKIYYLESNKDFWLSDPVDGSFVRDMRTPSNSGRNIIKDHSSFQQTPFKLDASVRIGWGIVNLYGTYAITPLFIKDRGPELYPFSVGITLNGW